MPGEHVVSDSDSPQPSGAASGFKRFIFLTGSAGLLVATAVDSIAVLGRHAGFTVLGSIEIVQMAVVLTASSAMVGATLTGAHASVHIVTERLMPATGRKLEGLASVLACFTFLLLAAGSIWVASDLWTGFERTELLGLPMRWFRMIWIGATLTVAALFITRARGRHA